MKSIARENGGGVGKSCLDLARTVTHFETHYKFFLKLCLVTNEKKNVVPTNVGLMHHKKGSFHQIKTSTKPFFKNVMVQYFQIQKYSHLFTSFQCHSNQFVAHFLSGFSTMSYHKMHSVKKREIFAHSKENS